MSSKLSRSVRQLVANHPHWLLAGMLLSLHAALAWGVGAWWSYAALLVHLGLFLLWQPLWQGERRLAPAHLAVLLAGGAVLFVAWHSWWLATLWLGVLVGLVGGDVAEMTRRRERLGHLLALLYLLATLLVWVVPHLFATAPENAALTGMVRYGLLWLPVLVAVLARGKLERRSFYAVDFFYSLMLFLLVVVLVLGSFAVKMISQSNYPMALAQTLMAIAGVLFLLSWLWDPHAGFAGGGQLMSRYLLGIGLPFERWLHNLAALAEREQDANDFLRLALDDIAALPWVAGVKWRAPGGAGEAGTVSGTCAEFGFHQVELVLYTRWAMSPTLILHVRLLTRLLGYFFEAKQREQEQKISAYTQAIHETGARLTHDVKNLLQSLKTLCAAAESSDADQAQALQELMQRQLPQIAQRLQLTLDKLKSPRVDTASLDRIDARAWWTLLQQRYLQDGVVFFDDLSDADPFAIPGELFDSVADNLLQNALSKRKLDPEISIEVEFSNGGRFVVCDSGTVLDDNLAARILNSPVPSENGLGVGLYQAARQAREAGYRLILSLNQPGKVCFELLGESPRAASLSHDSQAD